MKIILYNRDRANLWLEKEDSDIWKLKVDQNHIYVLKYMRIIGYPEIEAIDPSGGPFISVGDVLNDIENRFYKVIEIINCTTLKLEENGNN
jgi:hypothetical protein